MTLFEEYFNWLEKELDNWNELEKYEIGVSGRFDFSIEIIFEISMKLKKGHYEHFSIRFYYKDKNKGWIYPTLEELKIVFLSKLNKLKENRRNLRKKLHELEREIRYIKNELGEDK